jgi:hypothetical protein
VGFGNGSQSNDENSYISIFSFYLSSAYTYSSSMFNMFLSLSNSADREHISLLIKRAKKGWWNQMTPRVKEFLVSKLSEFV